MVETRNRPPKSCEPCRVRKLKCNRGLPCSTCARRGKEAQCHYAANADRTDRPRNKNSAVGERLNNLESLIMSLAQSGTPLRLNPSLVSAAENAFTPASPTAVNSTAGVHVAESEINAGTPSNTAPGEVLRDGALRETATAYVDSSHWSSFLDDIRSIRAQLSPVLSPEHDTGLSSSVSGTEAECPVEAQDEVFSEFTDLVLGSTEPLNREEILASLPSRQVCDSLVSHYFRSHFTILPILHPAKFLKEYDTFWSAQSETPIIWVGLLFSVLSMAASLKEFTTPGRAGPGRSVPSSKVLCKRTEQCLLIGQYTKSGEYSLEAMLVHIQSCYLHANDPDVNIWFTFGAVIRLAVRKGYHRDPSRLPTASISPFDAEMRRRIWTCIFQVDALMSFMIGLPSMIPSDYCDAELPLNLEYADLYPEMVALPPPRPASQHTPILYTIAKATVMAEFKKIVSHTRSLMLSPYENTMALDRQIREAYNGLPGSLKRKPLGLSIVDTPGIITHRITIEMLYLKSIIVLHRQYLTHRQDPRFEFSRRACLDAASSILERQLELDEAIQPRGQLYEDRWIVSSLTQNDFILAAMVICLDMTVSMRLVESTWKMAGKPTNIDLGSDFIQHCTTIEMSRRVWSAAGMYSSEARVVVHALGSTLQRANLYQQAGQLVATTPSPSSTLTNTPFQPNIVSPSDQSTAGQSPLPMDGMEFIDWSVLDNPFPNLSRDEMDLEAWIQDAVQPSSSPD